MIELIYAGKEVESLIKAKYPDSKVTDASDFVHTERFECDIPNISEDDFYPFAIREGFARCCFGFSILLNSLGFPELQGIGTHKETKDKIAKWIESAKVAAKSPDVTEG